jgi:hypothetical protein
MHYASAIKARALDGVASHGSVAEYIRDFRASHKLFEMLVAERLTREHGRAFHLWEDVALDVKDARGLPHPDTGIDVTDSETTIVQCKLRSTTLTWTDCATFLACAVAHDGTGLLVPWTRLLVARNACSRLSRHCAFFADKLRFDLPIALRELESTVTDMLLSDVPADSPTPVVELRGFQHEAIELCVRETPGAAYVVLPTGCGKSLVMARVAAHVELRVLIFVPLVVLMQQTLEILRAAGCDATAVGGSHEFVETARVVVCVYNSAHKLDLAAFDRILIDEAHYIRAPAIYTDLSDYESRAASVSLESDESGVSDESHASSVSIESPASSVSDESSVSVDSAGSAESACGYDAVRAAMTMPSARLFSATLDVPAGAERCTRTLREMIDAKFLCDYRLNIPVFEAGATNADLARHIVRSYRSMIVFCATRDEGTSFCAAMNQFGPCARYVDCHTTERERRETIGSFKSGRLAFIVNVRVLSVGFDAPITKGVCFVHMPASKTHIVQVIGRCLRLHRDKRCAQVVLPLVSGVADEDSRARDFMRVLSQNDAAFSRAVREHAGAPYVSVTRAVEESSHEADLLYTAVYDSMGAAVLDAWSARYEELVAFHAEHGTLPTRATPLGSWVHNERNARATMAPERKAKLEALPFWVWHTFDDAWDANYAALIAYHAAHNRIPRAKEGRLGTWVVTQRSIRASMDEQRKAKLDSLPWWIWRVMADWNERYQELIAHYAEHGRLPHFEDTRGLGHWVCKQRARRGYMSEDRKQKLEALAYWSWRKTTPWDTRFEELVAYHAEHGTLPSTSTAGLGFWCATQRNGYASMPAERRRRLEALEFWTWRVRGT